MSSEELIHKLTIELIGACKYCELISSDLKNMNPIYCSKFNGKFQLIPLNVRTCLACGEYKNIQIKDSASIS